VFKKHHVLLLAADSLRCTETKWIVDFANWQTGKLATRKAGNIYRNRSIKANVILIETKFINLECLPMKFE